ncbi:MAG: hypothetical protein ACD_4C00342G0005 [uncultured bacterium (gcode 4)]|uniref:Uncharacterized protein n=1 Tax=uncultured bacterium (gcode 4) TaxID=1234023 RepID=K2FWN7_9BACT|nr:MAG: hypothetical protein ACD_4C00342G0005 [uncultured bacterium (gcode 4)]
MIKSVKNTLNETDTESNIEILKQEINIYCELFIKSNSELKLAKESDEILDLNRLKLIFWEVNIKKEFVIMKIYELSYPEYQEIESYLKDKFLESVWIEKRSLAELKAWIINAKEDNLII